MPTYIMCAMIVITIAVFVKALPVAEHWKGESEYHNRTALAGFRCEISTLF